MEFGNQPLVTPLPLNTEEVSSSVPTKTPGEITYTATSAPSTSSHNGISSSSTSSTVPDLRTGGSGVEKVLHGMDTFDKMAAKLNPLNPLNPLFSNAVSCYYDFDKTTLLPHPPYLAESTVANIASIAKSVAEAEKKRAEEKPFQCTMCSKRYVNSAGLTVHMLTHKPEHQHHCQVCTMSFPTKQALKQHAVIHTTQQPNQCNICYKTFSYKSGLTHHMQEHAEDQMFTCGICRKVFNQRSNLNAHILTHTYEEKMTRLNSQNHEMSRSSVASFNQNITSVRSFEDARRPNSAQMAIETLQRQRILPHSFQNSDIHPSLNPFSGKDQIYSRTKSESLTDDPDDSEKQFPCDVCHKRFKQKATLRSHILTHVGSKPFACTVCDKRFTQRSGLDQHSVVHTGQRPHECPLCFKSFTQKANLNHHLLTHSGEKKFECLLCGRRFTQKANLQTHVLTHTGEKPYGCPICHKRFTQKGGLTHHLQSQHDTGSERSEAERASSALVHQSDNGLAAGTPSPQSYTSQVSSPQQSQVEVTSSNPDIVSLSPV